MLKGNRFQLQAEKLSATLGFSNPVFVGKGAFKETYRVSDSSGIHRALKVFDPVKSNIHRSQREIDAMKMCNCEFVGKLHDYGEAHLNGSGKTSYSVEDYLDGGTLSDKIKTTPLDLASLRALGVSMGVALSHLKGHNLVHRDIKPDNIMYQSGSTKPILVDFGLVRNLSETSLTATWLPSGPGTPFFSSPEQLNNNKALIKWRSDQFCLGVVLGYAILKYHPYEDHGMTPPQVVELVAQRKPLPQRFLNDVQKANLNPLIRMLEPWPVRRYPDPEAMISDLERMG
jgi:serine/threonine protein kinase